MYSLVSEKIFRWKYVFHRMYNDNSIKRIKTNIIDHSQFKNSVIKKKFDWHISTKI